MGLVGSLDDLSLADVLQIISLSQKSGVLELRSERGEGRLVFGKGLVRCAFVTGKPQDLKSLLVGGEFVDEAEFEKARTDSQSSGITLDEALAKTAKLSPERLDSLRRANIEGAVLSMLRWSSGEFSFEIREDVDDDTDLLLATGVNAQYLAMEATRLEDERQRPTPARDVGSDTTADAGRARAAREGDDGDADAGATQPGDGGRSERDDGSSWTGVDPIEGVSTPRDEPLPLVVIEPDLHALEWIRDALVEEFPRIHIFQRSELGVDRIRQYLGRAEIPLLVLSFDAPADRLTGARNARELARRLKRQNPRMMILMIGEEGRMDSGDRAEGVVVRARSEQIRDPDAFTRVFAPRLRARELRR